MSNLQCPFCGGTVTYRVFEPDGPRDYEPEHHFICDECEILVVLTDVSEQEARATYNKRGLPKVLKGKIKYYLCPECEKVWDSSELLYSEGNCLHLDNGCNWEDDLEEVTLQVK